jgi:hypothetical protein
MISIKGHIKVMDNGREPMDITEYSPQGFPELTFDSWDDLAQWGINREREARERASDDSVKVHT